MFVEKERGVENSSYFAFDIIPWTCGGIQMLGDAQGGDALGIVETNRTVVRLIHIVSKKSSQERKRQRQQQWSRAILATLTIPIF